MIKSAVSELILDRLAEGYSFQDLQKTYGFSKQDLIAAAIAGVEELHPEYKARLLKYLKK
ncbi:MAG: hypothetical protein HQM08_05415 [Candidatus Riflebacteria bacterium]|nr:hypothetical protein [Candidatus Riflebacteria bacterium]